MISPKNFDGQDTKNVVLAQKISFEKLCTILEENGCLTPKRLTVFEFYSRLSFYEEKNKTRDQGH